LKSPVTARELSYKWSWALPLPNGLSMGVTFVMTLILERFPLQYRAAVVTELMTVVQHGDSACLVGLAGVGKSNLARFLEVPAVVERSLPASEAARIHFRRVECSPEVDPDQIYEYMSQQVYGVVRKTGIPMRSMANTEENAFFQLRRLLDYVCGEYRQRIVFIFDEFEELVRHQQPLFLQNLRSLRDDHRTTRNVVFVVITHRLPHLIVQGSPINRHGKFFEIIRDRIYALPPYQKEDTDSMIDALIRQRGGDPTLVGNDKRDHLFHLSGGHSGLLSALFNELYPSFARSINTILHSVRQPCALQTVCEHIWSHLHTEEKRALVVLAQDQDISNDMLVFLGKRGLVRQEATALVLFSPIFAEYVRSQALTYFREHGETP
jgi:hypothetical protein